MNPDHEAFFCEEVRPIWLKSEPRPPGVWIREHAPIEKPEYALTTDVLAAWFLDAGTISVRSPSEFVRFITMHGTRPWHSGTQSPPSGVFGGRIHEIGLAGFAEVVGCELIYFEWQFGGCFGRGSTYALDDTGRLEVAETIYIS